MSQQGGKPASWAGEADAAIAPPVPARRLQGSATGASLTSKSIIAASRSSSILAAVGRQLPQRRRQAGAARTRRRSRWRQWRHPHWRRWLGLSRCQACAGALPPLSALQEQQKAPAAAQGAPSRRRVPARRECCPQQWPETALSTMPGPLEFPLRCWGRTAAVLRADALSCCAQYKRLYIQE